MKKANKILMATVAILLSLVLFSTSIVSGIYARFVIEKSGSVPIKFNKFGVGVELTLSDALKAAIGGEQALANCTTVNGNSVSINIDNLAMHPGVRFDDGIQFKLSGSPNTRVKLILDIDIDFDSEQFRVPAKFSSRWGTDFYVIPVGFTYSLFENETKYETWCDYYASAWNVISTDKTLVDPEYEILCALYYDFDSYSYKEYNGDYLYYTYLTGTYDYNTAPMSTNLAVETVIDTNGDFGFTGYYGECINGLNFSIAWPLEMLQNNNGSLNQEQMDKIAAYLCREDNDPTISVSYSIRVEQVDADYFPTWYS